MSTTFCYVIVKSGYPGTPVMICDTEQEAARKLDTLEEKLKERGVTVTRQNSLHLRATRRPRHLSEQWEVYKVYKAPYGENEQLTEGDLSRFPELSCDDDDPMPDEPR